jgi:hypothetical protein
LAAIKKMKTTLTYEFKTLIGVIRTYLKTNKLNHIVKIDNDSILTYAHEIRVETFEVLDKWVPNTMQFDTSRGWRWFITNRNDRVETLNIYCKGLSNK